MSVHQKYTPSNCKLDKCSENCFAPGENSQECIGCAGNKNQRWRPVVTWEKPVKKV
jgi:hypothetical protein